MKIKDLFMLSKVEVPKVDRPREKLDQFDKLMAGKYGPAVPVRLVRHSFSDGGSFMRRRERLSDSELLTIN